MSKVKKARKLARRIAKYEERLPKYENMVKEIREWIRSDKKELKQLLSTLADEELLLYGELLDYLSPPQ